MQSRSSPHSNPAARRRRWLRAGAAAHDGAPELMERPFEHRQLRLPERLDVGGVPPEPPPSRLHGLHDHSLDAALPRVLRRHLRRGRVRRPLQRVQHLGVVVVVVREDDAAGVGVGGGGGRPGHDVAAEDGVDARRAEGEDVAGLGEGDDGHGRAGERGYLGRLLEQAPAALGEGDLPLLLALDAAHLDLLLPLASPPSRPTHGWLASTTEEAEAAAEETAAASAVRLLLSLRAVPRSLDSIDSICRLTRRGLLNS